MTAPVWASGMLTVADRLCGKASKAPGEKTRTKLKPSVSHCTVRNEATLAVTSWPSTLIVNGSLWTLRLECGLYLVLAAAGVLGLLRIRGTAIALALGALALGLVVAVPRVAGSFPFAHQVTVLCLTAIPYFLGAALAQSGVGSAGTARVMAMVALAALPLVYAGAGQFYLVLLLPFATLLLAWSFVCGLPGRGDYSYGIYLWAFPVQQGALATLPGIAPLPLFGVAAVLTLGCAALSWHLVERPALAFRPRRPAAG